MFAIQLESEKIFLAIVDPRKKFFFFFIIDLKVQNNKIE